MRALKDMVAKREQFQAKIAQRLAVLPPADDVLMPPNPAICEVCLGFGFVGYGVGVDDPNFGKVQPCTAPDCQVRVRLAQERAARLKDALPNTYRDYTFESWWEQVPQHQQAGKYLPFYVLRYMATHLKQAFFISDVLDVVGVPYQAYDANGVAMLRVNIRGTVEEIQNAYACSAVLEGAYGTSKTGLAVAAMNEARQRGFSTALIDLPDFIQQIQATYKRDFDNPHEALLKLLAPIEAVDLLVIDEGNVAEGNGSGEASEDKIRIFTDYIVKPRWLAVNNKPFILTTNKPYPEFLAHWGGRVTSRLAERAFWLRFVGEPIRHLNRPI